MKRVLFIICLLTVGCAGNEAAQSTFAGATDLPALADLPSLPESVHRNESAAFQYDWYWSEYYQKSDNAVPVDGALLLGSEPGQVSWVMYEFGVNFEADQAQFSFHCNSDAEGVVYVGFSDYGKNCWRFETVPVVLPLSVPLSVPIPDCQSMPSGDGSFFVVILAWDGMEIEVERVSLLMAVANIGPKNLQASDGAHLEYIWINWDPVPYADGYTPEYKRSSDGDDSWKALIGAPTNSTNYSHDNFADPGDQPEYNVLYDYRVKAHFVDGDWSDYSNVDSGYRRTPAPGNVNATSNIIVDKVYLGWDQVFEVPDRSYKIYRKRSDEDVYAFMHETTENTWFDDNLPDTAAYDYVIETIGPDGPSDYSDPAQGSALTFEFSTFLSLSQEPSDIRLMENSGELIAAYFNPSANDLFVGQPRTMPPAGSDDWKQFGLGQEDSFGKLELGLLGARPALAFTTTEELRFSWCSEGLPLESPTWTTTVLQDSTDSSGFRPTWTVAGGFPVVASRIVHTAPFWQGLIFFFPEVPEPQRDDEWLSYGLRGESAGEVVGMRLVEGNPYLVYSEINPGMDLGLLKATEALPLSHLSWTQHGMLEGTGFTRLGLEMTIHQGHPLLAYGRHPTGDPSSGKVLVYYGKMAAPDQPDEWWPSGLIQAPGSSYGGSLDLDVINGNPGICFYDSANSTLMLAISSNGIPDVDSWFVSEVTGLNGTGVVCSLSHYQGLPVLLYYDAVDEEIKFAYGQ